MTHKKMRKLIKKELLNYIRRLLACYGDWHLYDLSDAEKAEDTRSMLWWESFQERHVSRIQVAGYGWIIVLKQGGENDVRIVYDTVARKIRASLGHKHNEREIPIEMIPYINDACAEWKKKHEDDYQSIGLLGYAMYVTVREWNRI